MKKIKHRIVFLITFVSVLQFSACQQWESNYKKIEPSHLEHIENSELSKLILTKRATERLAIKIQTVVEESLEKSKIGQLTRKVTPYSSVIYDAHGQTWVYTNPEPLVFLRHEIKIDFIQGNKAYLLDGPPIGTNVVAQGAAELFGTEYDIGH